MTPDEIAEIARGLSRAAAVDLRLGRCVRPGNECCLCDSDHLKPLIRHGLVETHGATIFRTATGRQVRSHLIEQERM